MYDYTSYDFLLILIYVELDIYPCMHACSSHMTPRSQNSVHVVYGKLLQALLLDNARVALVGRASEVLGKC